MFPFFNGIQFRATAANTKITHNVYESKFINNEQIALIVYLKRK